MRAFRPSSSDKSGLIDLEVTVRNLPSGGSVRWSRPEAGTITIDNPTSLRTRVRGLRPGKTAIDVSVHEAGGNKIESMKIQLSVPHFVRITEDAAAFDGILSSIQLLDVKDDVMSNAKEVVDHLLRKANVRTLWQIGGLSETMPAHIPASNFMVVTMKGEPPEHALRGITNPPGGLNVFNESIDIYPGAFDDTSANDIDTETQALVLELESANMTDPALKAFGAKMYGRLLGETIAHEIVHGLLWDQINPPTDHNNPAIANDLMNAGLDRTFRQRTGLENTASVSPLQASHFVDHGINAIGELQATNQALIDQHFPVPPAFA
jgi:hypothetical protein